MSFVLFRKGIKDSIRLFLILAAVLAMYFIIITTMYDPTLNSALDALVGAMPEVMAVMGMANVGSSLVSFLASYLYGFIMLIFPMVYSILTANRLVARQVDRGDMAYLLAAPSKRLRIVLTQLAVLLTGVVGLILFGTLVCLAACALLFPGALDVQGFLYMNLGALCLQLFIAGICFVCSCLFNDVKYSIGLGAGIPALAYIIQMLANFGSKLEGAKYFTFFTLFDPKGLIAGQAWAGAGIAILFAAAVLLFITAGQVFTRKDMPV